MKGRPETMMPSLLLPALLALAPGKEARMELRIPAFQNGTPVPRAHTADGADHSPALQ